MHPVMQLKNAQNCLGGKAKSINVEYKSYGQFHEFKVYGMKFYLLPIHTKALLLIYPMNQPNNQTNPGGMVSQNEIIIMRSSKCRIE